MTAVAWAKAIAPQRQSQSETATRWMTIKSA